MGGRGTQRASSLSPSFHAHSWSTQQKTPSSEQTKYNKSPQGNTVPYTQFTYAPRMYPPYPYKLQYTTVNRKVPPSAERWRLEPRRIHSRMFKARRPCVARFVAPPGRAHSTRDAQRALRISPCGPTTLATPAPPPAARPATCAACCRRGEAPRGAGPC